MTTSDSTSGITDMTMADRPGPPEPPYVSGDGIEDDVELSEAEIEAFRREQIFASEDRISPDDFPRMWNVSAAFLYRAVIRAEVPERPEYVTVPMPDDREDGSLTLLLAVTQWNQLWEAAQFRRRFFDEDELPAPLSDIANRGDVNVMFVPRSETRYHEYSALYHLLPRATLELPPDVRGQGHRPQVFGHRPMVGRTRVGSGEPVRSWNPIQVDCERDHQFDATAGPEPLRRAGRLTVEYQIG